VGRQWVLLRAISLFPYMLQVIKTICSDRKDLGWSIGWHTPRGKPFPFSDSNSESDESHRLKVRNPEVSAIGVGCVVGICHNQQNIKYPDQDSVLGISTQGVLCICQCFWENECLYVAPVLSGPVRVSLTIMYILF